LFFIRFRNEGKDSRIATVVIRGATDNFMDDIERALDDAVNNFKCLTRDGRYLPGAGATEIELATQLSAYADTLPGLDQYILPDEGTFNVDNIRICKILGSGLTKSEVVRGMVFKRFVEGDVTYAEKAKIVIFSCPVDIIQTETKGTVLIKSADELLSFSSGEESLLESQIKAIADTGVKVVVAGGKVGDMALHFLNKYGLMAVRLNSKFDLRRLSRSVNATVLPRITTPSQEELGYCDKVCIEELGDTTIVAFRWVDQRNE